MLEIKIKKNPAYGEHSREDIPRYFFELNLEDVVPRAGSANLSVYWRPNKAGHPILKEIYSTEIAGTLVEKGNLTSLKNAIPDLVSGLINYNTLPYYYLCVLGEVKIPIFLVEDRLRLNYKGENFVTKDITELYKKLVTHLLGRGQIKTKDEISFGLLFWKELRLYPIGFIFSDVKQNSWIPIFYKLDGEITLNYDKIGSPSRILQLNELFALWQEVACGLVNAKIISSIFDLHIERLEKILWERLTPCLKANDFAFNYYFQGKKSNLAVFSHAKELFCVQEDDFIKIIFGQDLETLKSNLATRLIKEKLILDISELGLEKIRR